MSVGITELSGRKCEKWTVLIHYYNILKHNKRILSSFRIVKKMIKCLCNVM
jgi:hypothetical protein